MTSHLLNVENLTVGFDVAGEVRRVVHGVSFVVDPAETVGIVGESGSGKSLTALSIVQLIAPPGRIIDGRILLNGRELIGLPAAELTKLRGREISVVFQDPATSLNPVFTVGSQLIDVIRSHQGLGHRAATSAAADVLASVGILQPAARLKNYPYELSGGMRQRIMIAMAVACRPRLLILDEPTTALDVTIQAQVMDVIGKLRRDLNIAVLFITHNLNLAAEVCDRMLVMYAGEIVEEASAEVMFSQPRHPYTQALLDCIPRLAFEQRRLGTIPGQPPTPGAHADHCAFADRCNFATVHCRTKKPRLESVGSVHRAACFKTHTAGQDRNA